MAPHHLNLIKTDWTKGGGLGSPQRFFRPLLGVQKWARGSGAEPPPISTRVRARQARKNQARGWVSPGLFPPGDGRISPASARCTCAAGAKPAVHPAAGDSQPISPPAVGRPPRRRSTYRTPGCGNPAPAWPGHRPPPQGSSAAGPPAAV